MDDFRRRYVYPLWNESQVFPYEGAMDIMDRHLRAALEDAAKIADEDARLGRQDLDDPELDGLAGARILAAERIAAAIRRLMSSPSAKA